MDAKFILLEKGPWQLSFKTSLYPFSILNFLILIFSPDIFTAFYYNRMQNDLQINL